MEDIKAKFLKNERIENIKKENTSVLAELIDFCEVKIPYKTRKWINEKVIAFWGNQKIECATSSKKIFEILNKIKKVLGN